jgi:hypothetical protein
VRSVRDALFDELSSNARASPSIALARREAHSADESPPRV